MCGICPISTITYPMIYNPAQISIWYVGDLYVNKYMNLFRMHTPNKVIKNQLAPKTST